MHVTAKGICTVSSFDPLSTHKLGTPRVVSTNEMKYCTERNRNPEILLLRAKNRKSCQECDLCGCEFPAW